MQKESEQLALNFDPVASLPLMSVGEIYAAASDSLLSQIKEDRRIERKPATYQPKALGDYFSMWANTIPEGGVIVVGIENDGAISGCSKVGTTHINKLERVGDIYCPDARHETKRICVSTSKGAEDFLLIIRVYYNAKKVVKSVSGKAFVRRGESKTELKDYEIRELEIDKGQIELEQEPTDFIYPQDFDTDLVRQYVNNYRINRELREELPDVEILALRHLGTLVAGRFIPNIACALLFAENPTSRFPGCKIRFLRFEGEHEGTGERWNAIKDIIIDEGSIPRQIVEAERVIDSQIRAFTRLGLDNKFHTSPEYPKVAWYEALVNACVHRSYNLKNMNIFVRMFDDRLEIESPGGFPPLVTPNNIYNMHHPRNPFLMDAMFYLKFVRAAREGTRRMRDSMIAMELPMPEFSQREIEHALVNVRLRNAIKHRKVFIDSDAIAIVGAALFDTLTEEERRAINFVAERGTVSVSDLQRLTQKTWPACKKVLIGLVNKRVLEHRIRKDSKRDPQARFVLRASNGKA